MRSGQPVVTSTRAVLVLSAIWLTGCVSAADGPSPTEPHQVTTTTSAPVTTTTLGFQEALETYRSCLGEEGVTIGVITLDGLGRPRLANSMSGLDFTDRIVLAALEKCGPLLASGALDLSTDPRLATAIHANLRALAECIRDFGLVDFPDPIPGFDGVGSPFPTGQIPWQDERLSNAVTVCTSAVGRSSG